jgi:hypothetical protein
MQLFEKVVDHAGKIGLKVIFDHHNNEGLPAQQPNGLWFNQGPGTEGLVRYFAGSGSGSAVAHCCERSLSLIPDLCPSTGFELFSG